MKNDLVYVTHMNEVSNICLFQEKERRRKALEEALERAKHEAEITRKARVFKHVLEGADKSPELERRLLGVDPETGDRILHEVRAEIFRGVEDF